MRLRQKTPANTKRPHEAGVELVFGTDTPFASATSTTAS